MNKIRYTICISNGMHFSIQIVYLDPTHTFIRYTIFLKIIYRMR